MPTTLYKMKHFFRRPNFFRLGCFFKDTLSLCNIKQPTKNTRSVVFGVEKDSEGTISFLPNPKDYLDLCAFLCPSKKGNHVNDLASFGLLFTGHYGDKKLVGLFYRGKFTLRYRRRYGCGEWCVIFSEGLFLDKTWNGTKNIIYRICIHKIIIHSTL